MSYMSRNPQVASVVLDDIAATTPGNPPAGKHKIVDRMGNIYVRDSAGAETIIASAAGNGSGEKNYVTNPSGASSISGWANVGDLDIVRTITAGDLPRENTTKTGLKITADANAQTVADYVYCDFSLDDVDAAGRVMKLKWDQKVTGTYTAGQLEVYIATQAARGTVAVTPFITAIPAKDGTFETYFLAPATATASLVIRCTGEMATDGGIVISDVVVGPNVQVQGSAIGAWKSFTPTGSWSANTTYTGFYREVGEDVEINVNIALAGAPTSAALTVNMPTGFTINSSKMAATTSAAILGLVSIYDAAPATYEGRILYSSTSAVAVVVEKSDGTYGAYVAVTEAVPQTFANGDKVQLSYKVPVNELSSNVTLLSNTNTPTEAAGAIQAYAGATAPKGWALCVGTELAIASYPDLYANIGTTWNTSANPLTGSAQSAPSAGNFRIPNLQGAFLRGVADYAGADAYNTANDVALGSYRVDQGQGHWHTVSRTNGDTIKDGNYAAGGSGIGLVEVGTASIKARGLESDLTNGAPRAGFETAPKQVGINYIIRLFNSGLGAGVCPISSANIVGRTDGVAPAAGMVGEIIGTAQGGTNATVYATTSSTAPATTGTLVIQQLLKKGTYWVSVLGQAIKANNTSQDRVYYYWYAGAATSVVVNGYDSIVAGGILALSTSFPVVVSVDDTAVGLKVFTVANNATSAIWHMSSIRIA